MKKFNKEKFCSDLKELRGKSKQEDFAKLFNVNRSTLSLLETGKQLPSLEIMNLFCDLNGKTIEEYFFESRQDSLLYLMGYLEEEDVQKLEDMVTRIQLKEKYEYLAKRSSDALV